MGATGLESQKLERILHLYMAVKTTPEKTPSQLQQELGIKKSAYSRYRTLLRGIGVDFRFDRKTRSHVILSDSFLTAPDLTLDERLAIILAVSRLGGLSESFLAARARQAARKLLTVNRTHIAKACSALLKGPEMPAHIGGKADVVDGLFRAITELRRIRIEYRKPNFEPKMYEVDPYQLFVLEGALYLDGYCLAKKAVRCFKVCRIQQVWLQEVVFSNFRNYAYEKCRKNSFCVYTAQQDPEKVQIRFSAAVAPYIREDYRHSTQSLVEQEDGSLIFEVNVSEPREVLWWALRWGENFEVLEPGWLREETMQKVKKMAGVYGMGVDDTTL